MSSDHPDPEYIAIILAATQGTRLFPLTSDYPSGIPKHLLPILPLNSVNNDNEDAGCIPLLQRLLIHTFESSFEMVVITINKEDNMTIPFLLGKDICFEQEDNCNINSSSGGLCKLLSKEHKHKIAHSCRSTSTAGGIVTDLEFCGEMLTSSSNNLKHVKSTSFSTSSTWMHVRVVRLPNDCHGSADALRFLSGGYNNTNFHERSQIYSSKEQTCPESSSQQRSDTARKLWSFIPCTSHAVVIPGDLILESHLLGKIRMENSNLNDDNHMGIQDAQDLFSLLVQSHRCWNASSAVTASAAVTMLLTDLGAEDKEGVPLKESSKSKMGLFSREEEDIEYIGLSSEIPLPLSGSLASTSSSNNQQLALSRPSRRVVLKRPKLDVEEDEGTGATPKLTVMKRRLHASGRIQHGKVGKYQSQLLSQMLSNISFTSPSISNVDHSPSLSLHTDLHDVHVYVISNWVFDLLHARPSMSSFQKEVLPLLVSRQFRGVEAAFGLTSWKVEDNRNRLKRVLRELDSGINSSSEEGLCNTNASNYNNVSALLGMFASSKAFSGLGRFSICDSDGERPSDEFSGTPKHMTETSSAMSLKSLPPFPNSSHPFVVSAHVLSRKASSLTLRACTLPSLLFGCSEVTSCIIKLDANLSISLIPKNAQLSTKFNSISLPGCRVGEKVQTKACTIGRNVILGDRARLNNVVVMDGAVIGENSILQNSVVGVGAKIGDNCNLKDCNVGPRAVVASGTKTIEKQEAFHT